MNKRKLFLAIVFEIVFIAITLFGKFSNETYSEAIFIVGLIAVVVFTIGLIKDALADALHDWLNKK